MCGIAGRVSLANRPLDVAPLGAMMDLVSYRGPDDQGYALFGLNGQPARSGKDSFSRAIGW